MARPLVEAQRQTHLAIEYIVDVLMDHIGERRWIRAHALKLRNISAKMRRPGFYMSFNMLKQDAWSLISERMKYPRRLFRSMNEYPSGVLFKLLVRDRLSWPWQEMVCWLDSYDAFQQTSGRLDSPNTVDERRRLRRLRSLEVELGTEVSMNSSRGNGDDDQPRRLRSRVPHHPPPEDHLMIQPSNDIIERLIPRNTHTESQASSDDGDDGLTCPITLCKIVHPVFTRCCHRLFERDALSMHFKFNRNSCPVCRARCLPVDVVV